MCDDCDWEDALAKVEAIQEKIEDLPERADEFASGVEERTASIGGWIEENEHVTQAQVEALENMEHGVERWLR